MYHTYFLLAMKIMALMGLVVFVALYFVDAGYGKFRSNKWGYSIGNKWGWFLMEFPALVPVIAFLTGLAGKPGAVQTLFLCLYALHYTYRSFIFPRLLKGKSQMPLVIIGMGMVFNLVNSTLIGAFTMWFPKPEYADFASHATQWNFVPGIALFFAGMYTHMKSDHIIRNLRKPGDTNHYLPKGGMFNYVTSANYLGELMEWTGFAILLGNPAGWMFVWWTAANLVPRAHAIHRKYREEFGNEAVGHKPYPRGTLTGTRNAAVSQLGGNVVAYGHRLVFLAVKSHLGTLGEGGKALFYGYLKIFAFRRGAVFRNGAFDRIGHPHIFGKALVRQGAQAKPSAAHRKSHRHDDRVQKVFLHLRRTEMRSCIQTRKHRSKEEKSYKNDRFPTVFREKWRGNASRKRQRKNGEEAVLQHMKLRQGYGQFLAAQNVEVEMLHGLSAVLTAVGDHAVTVLRQPKLPGNHGDRLQHCRHGGKVLLTHLLNGGNMGLGDHQHVNGGVGVDIVEGVDVFVLVHLLGGDLPCYDLTKQAVFHF